MTTHELKTWPIFFQAILDGRKTFELRKDDRQFSTGDILWLREWHPTTQGYTGRDIRVAVTYKVVGFGLKDGYCTLAFTLDRK